MPLQPRYNINALRLFIHKHPPPSTIRCSFIQLGELEQRRLNELAHDNTRL